jgi:hypothetical protein
MNPRSKKVQYKSPYKLLVVFDNNEEKEFDLTPYLIYPVFERLKDEVYCMKARVHHGIVIWDDETDLDPDTLYLESRTLISA